MLRLRAQFSRAPGARHAAQQGAHSAVFCSACPFPLTARQQPRRSKSSTEPCNNAQPDVAPVVQGDVGAGKTVVKRQWPPAGNWKLVAGRFDWAPTGKFLQSRHHANSQRLVFASPGKFPFAWLAGKIQGQKVRRTSCRMIATGDAPGWSGPHALFQGEVQFRNLGLGDYRRANHRFGVQQRLALRDKGGPPEILAAHSCIITATPIPRTLAMKRLRGFWDTSLLDEVAAGAHPVQYRIELPTAAGKKVSRAGTRGCCRRSPGLLGMHAD